PDATSSEYITISEGPSGSVAGVVRSADGEPVPAARVTLGESTVTTTTDAAGRYIIGRLRPDVTVPVNVSAPGFGAAISPLTVTANERSEVNVTLTPVARPTADGSTLDVPADRSSVGTRGPRVVNVPSLTRNDVFRAFQFLPSVDATNDISSSLFV